MKDMEKIFSKPYRQYTGDIRNFLDSNSDILYISGFSGTGKSSVLKNALDTYEKEILNFCYLSFKNTVTDDFLLSFYDTFRMYALKQVINLTKNPEEEFVQKVNFYFKNLEYPAVVVIDNFETIPDESDITDLLIHISGFENVKLIVISKNPSCRLTQTPTVSMDRINFEKINPSEFADAAASKFPGADNALIKKLYDAAEGHELYLKMALSYMESMSFPLAEFIEEFENKETSFENFIMEKQVSLIPAPYYPILKNLAYINHNVRPVFIETYGLGDTKQIPYLFSKFMISEFWGTYYIKSYLRNYFEEITSIQDRTQAFRKLVSIYENELEKSPKDRILRLSRESIRNQIAQLEKTLPKAAKTVASPVFNYVPIPIETTPQWYITGNTGMSKPRRQFKKRAKASETKVPSQIEMLTQKAVFFENKYDYKSAVAILEQAKKTARTLEDKICIYSKISQDLLKINDNNAALSNLTALCAACQKEGEINSYAKFRIEIGKIYKKLYAFSRAKTCFKEIAEKKDAVSKETLASAKISLAEIYELENNFQDAINEYKSVIEFMPENSEILPEITYKLGVLQDEAGLYEDALEKYLDSIRYAEISGSYSYLVKSYTACGLIYSDMGQTADALSYLEYALALSKNSQNHLDSYYIARDIAGIYRSVEPEKAYDYLIAALDYAQFSGNSFEIAISLLEMGDYYYDLKQNEQALICYFQAKSALGKSASKENAERVTTRINDMKIKLGDYVFRAMKAMYDLQE